MTSMNRKTVAIILTVVAVMAISVISMFITLAVVDSSRPTESYYLSGENHAIIERYSRLNEVYERLMNEYYKEPDPDQLIQGAIDGMMASLGDPYTIYYTPEEMEKDTQAQSGLYSGIGILTTGDANGNMVILRVFTNSPAREAGILPGDVLLEADGFSLNASTNEELNEAITHIKGENGTTVDIKVQRKDEILLKTVRRDQVTVNRVEYEILEGNVGYVVLYEFFGDAVSGVREAFEAFKEAHVQGVIFDVRSNTGGLLDASLEICRMILPEGVIVYTEDRYGYRENYYSNADHYDFPMVILVNGLTASASEVFSASAQEYGVATLVGTRTYGKGIVQTQYPFFSDGAGMKLTTSSYYTASGRSIHGEGIEPDVVVELWDQYDPSDYTPNMENDNQLKVAYDTLMERIAANP